VNNGERTEEAFEAIECPEALDAVQDGRDMGASPFPRSAQVKRVSTSDTDPQK